MDFSFGRGIHKTQPDRQSTDKRRTNGGQRKGDQEDENEDPQWLSPLFCLVTFEPLMELALIIQSPAVLTAVCSLREQLPGRAGHNLAPSPVVLPPGTNGRPGNRAPTR